MRIGKQTLQSQASSPGELFAKHLRTHHCMYNQVFMHPGQTWV